MQDRKMYPSLDIVKFIMALLILMQHTANDGAHSTGLVHAFFRFGQLCGAILFRMQRISLLFEVQYTR